LLSQIASRIIIELGPWLWILSGFTLMFTEVFSGRGIGLSLALGALIAGTMAVFGASGVLPATSGTIQSFIFLASTLAIFTAIKLRQKKTEL
jgi:membrane protein implicated in regulation of membrane protease activity